MDSWVTALLFLVLACLLWLRIRIAEHEGAQRCTRLLLEEARRQLDMLQEDCRGDDSSEDYRFACININLQILTDRYTPDTEWYFWEIHERANQLYRRIRAMAECYGAEPPDVRPYYDEWDEDSDDNDHTD